MSKGRQGSVAAILWRRIDRAGHDAALLHEHAHGALLRGTAVFSESGEPCRLDYHVECDAGWRTVSAHVAGWIGTSPIDLEIAVDAARVWSLNRRPCPGVRGCEDLDLSFSPATNLLPIRRLDLGVGARASVRAAWLRFPAPVLEPLDQTYERTADRRYAYTSAGGFTAELDTTDAGFVTHYSGLWQCVAPC